MACQSLVKFDSSEKGQATRASFLSPIFDNLLTPEVQTSHALAFVNTITLSNLVFAFATTVCSLKIVQRSVGGNPANALTGTPVHDGVDEHCLFPTYRLFSKGKSSPPEAVP